MPFTVYKPNNDLYEVRSTQVKAHPILNDHLFNFNSIIKHLQFQPNSKPRFFIHLYRLLSMSSVRPTLLSDVIKLE